MSSDLAIDVRGVSKCYQIYATPGDRLKQFIVPKLTRLGGGDVRYYKEFWAVRDVSFEVKRGESVGILGRNGSGKSTLLQMVCGTLAPTSGAVHTSGRIAALLELGSGFNPEFSGRENVYLNAALLGLTREETDAKFDAIAAFADIGEFIEQPVKTYSSGMMIRLAFAVQVQVEPDILVVDEALAVGDVLFQKRCFQRIEKLVSGGTTLLFVSHDQESVRTLTHRALLLKEGRRVAWGLSSDVVLQYRKQMHEEESAYFAQVAANLSEKAQSARAAQDAQAPRVHAAPPAETQAPAPATTDPAPGQEVDTPQIKGRSDRLTFGDGGAHVTKVEVLDDRGEVCTLFYPGDTLRLRVHCDTRIRLEHLNVGVRLRNKEGVKMYSWGTLNQDMARMAGNARIDGTFWARAFKADSAFTVDFVCRCPLGINLYEVQASISYEETPDYLGQRMLHWMDEAAFFQVSQKREEYFFGGVMDMQMTASWSDHA